VLFDIDYTLFNTKKFREKLYRGLKRVLKRDMEDVGTEIYQDVRRELGYFNPNLFLKRLAKYLPREADSESLKKVIWDEEAMRSCIYPEVEKTLGVLSKKAGVGIFSKGYSKFQKAKLLAIEHFLDRKHIHVTVNKEARLPNLIKEYRQKKLYLVDDALEVLWEAKKLNGDIFTIWVKRGIFAQVKKPIRGFQPDSIVLNLIQIPNLIKEG
jgi:hypothetical protein